jgi:hypothetical protein
LRPGVHSRRPGGPDREAPYGPIEPQPAPPSINAKRGESPRNGHDPKAPSPASFQGRGPFVPVLDGWRVRPTPGRHARPPLPPGVGPCQPFVAV